ncbi:hypothetical protein [Nocardia asteroides]|uniref:hypothetical protein n=1 Tax=Nocardia asteroides TaxID=1824 RepID=UPI0034126DA0
MNVTKYPAEWVYAAAPINPANAERKATIGMAPAGMPRKVGRWARSRPASSVIVVTIPHPLHFVGQGIDIDTHQYLYRSATMPTVVPDISSEQDAEHILGKNTELFTARNTTLTGTIRTK